MDLRTYKIADSFTIADDAVFAVTRYMRAMAETVEIFNVEKNIEYQKRDIDLIWKFKLNGLRMERLIEVKGDTYDRTGNFFFETISNEEHQTPGCFLYSEADDLYYYFVTTKRLYILPLRQTRAWFIENIDKYPLRKTSTLTGTGSFYITVGRIVPITDVLNAIPDATIHNLANTSILIQEAIVATGEKVEESSSNVPNFAETFALTIEKIARPIWQIINFVLRQ
ncbi:hypothetical protein A2763_03215 [Candidatus Kaiserbacteria bacterium RIFCSPHIGHO2_01_FULL_54_36]|uniref:Uncharacterized protein n=1 Tax=Candidatus Kaiserbacteria bacterium RIFCSPHIGHO2_01_FULL_54_36 TaxID=1798482 RepID=A0A1F6CK87_9BACT|nr:MAG: hypothetical protein A2763_03215 [Candidatus Kaiserbacteria bacterium RIFCSPHIGHO2_01_FULL_54_36]OGG75408.1 MAG: hypothetical protein A3A41_02470 [Candidatus Kaiserbacteria bacterium RIFCSPLOWO2_01_FULL_54_22]